MKQTNLLQKKLGSENKGEKVSRRSMLKQTRAATGGVLLTASTVWAAPAIITKREMISVEFAGTTAVAGGKNFLARMFNFRNKFWRGFGAVALALAKRSLGLEGLNLGESDRRQYETLESYTQSQQSAGWNPAAGSEIYRLPNTSLSYGVTNGSQDNFRDIVAGNGNRIASLNPACLIALAQFAEALRCQCPNFSNTDLANWLVPQQTVAATVEPANFNGYYEADFRTKNGLMTVTQTPVNSPYNQKEAELMVEVREAWSPKDIVYKTKRPMIVGYNA